MHYLKSRQKPNHGPAIRRQATMTEATPPPAGEAISDAAGPRAPRRSQTLGKGSSAGDLATTAVAGTQRNSQFGKRSGSAGGISLAPLGNAILHNLTHGGTRASKTAGAELPEAKKLQPLEPLHRPVSLTAPILQPKGRVAIGPDATLGLVRPPIRSRPYCIFPSRRTTSHLRLPARPIQPNAGRLRR